MSKLPDFDPDAIRKLADILVDTGLTEIEVAAGDARIRVARKPAAVHASLPAGPAQASPAAVPALPAAAPLAQELEDDSTHPGAVNSPMVGVAYLSSEPGSPPTSFPASKWPPGRP